jgi:hypothetical protein
MTAVRHTWYVANQLFLGDPPDRPGATAVTTVEAALEVMAAGGEAVLPVGAWDLADEVMWRRDYGRALRRHLLHWARTGAILKPVPKGMPDEPAEPPPRVSAVDPAWSALPEVSDAFKVARPDKLQQELAALEVEDDYRHAAVVRIAADAAARGMDPDHALRRALDETAACDEAFDAMLAQRLAEVEAEYGPRASLPGLARRGFVLMDGRRGRWRRRDVRKKRPGGPRRGSG